MPFSALFALVAFLVSAAIFLVTLKNRGLKKALLYSGVGLLSFVAIFIVLLSFTLNNM